MGWLFYGRVPSDIRAEIARLCGSANTEPSLRAIAIARVGSTWYAAVEARHATTAAAQAGAQARQFPPREDGSCVFAAVFLTDVGGDGWGYKGMEETMGPVASEAPAAILDLLTPTTSAHALAWRERCRAAGQVEADELWFASW